MRWYDVTSFKTKHVHYLVLGIFLYPAQFDWEFVVHKPVELQKNPSQQLLENLFFFWLHVGQSKQATWPPSKTVGCLGQDRLFPLSIFPPNLNSLFALLFFQAAPTRSTTARWRTCRWRRWTCAATRASTVGWRRASSSSCGTPTRRRCGSTTRPPSRGLPCPICTPAPSTSCRCTRSTPRANPNRTWCRRPRSGCPRSRWTRRKVRTIFFVASNFSTQLTFLPVPSSSSGTSPIAAATHPNPLDRDRSGGGHPDRVVCHRAGVQVPLRWGHPAAQQGNGPPQPPEHHRADVVAGSERQERRQQGVRRQRERREEPGRDSGHDRLGRSGESSCYFPVKHISDAFFSIELGEYHVIPPSTQQVFLKS